MVGSGFIKPGLGMVLSFAASILAKKREGLNQEQIRKNWEYKGYSFGVFEEPPRQDRN